MSSRLFFRSLTRTASLINALSVSVSLRAKTAKRSVFVHICYPNTKQRFLRRATEMTPHIWRMFLSPDAVSLFSVPAETLRVRVRTLTRTLTRMPVHTREQDALRVGIGSLLDDSNYLNYAAETMPLSQQLSGLVEESTGVKALREQSARHFDYVLSFFVPVPLTVCLAVPSTET